MIPGTLYQTSKGHRRRFIGTFTTSYGKERTVYEAVIPPRPTLGNSGEFLPDIFKAQANGFFHECETLTFENWARKAWEIVILHTSTVTVPRPGLRDVLTCVVELQETKAKTNLLSGKLVCRWVNTEAVDEYGNKVSLTQGQGAQALQMARAGYDETGR